MLVVLKLVKAGAGRREHHNITFDGASGGELHRFSERLAVLDGRSACLLANHGMIASFSRALVQDLRVSMSDAEFEAALAQSIDEIYRASTIKA